jgi:threonine dehydrogenase-like Zn-dependent dehydrogenase
MRSGLKRKAAPRKRSSAILKSKAAAAKRCVSALLPCVAAVVAVPGVYAGFIHGFLFGDAFDKGLTFKMGQTHVHAWLGELLPLIEKGLLTPEEIVTHYLSPCGCGTRL